MDEAAAVKGFFDSVLGWWWLVPIALIVFGWKSVLRLFGVIIIPDGMSGLVTKKFVLFGEHKTLPDGAIVALNGEAGVQADMLPPGVHYFKWPWQYDIERVMFVEVSEGKIGVVVSRDGAPLPQGRILGRKVECDAFQDARKFLTGGGERGPQIAVIPPGVYRINPSLFEVEMEDAVDVPDNQMGVVTTKEGSPLPAGDVVGRTVEGHNSFQDAQAFIDAGGSKGPQLQVILSGRYYINPYFATVEMKSLFHVPIATCGVVISYVGDDGVDTTGDGFRHGNLVSRGQKGVWNEPLDPGKYALNPVAYKIEIVPTANVVLNWATGKTEAHELDKNLSTIAVRSADGFRFNIDVSQIIHIPRTEAPKVIARFGTVISMVNQVLEPIIGNYFRNTAQGSDVIDFLQHRKTRQDEAKASISEALKEYNVAAVDTLIGDISPPEELMQTLTDRKIAQQQKLTFEQQKEAQKARQEFEQANALAETQRSVVDAERSVSIAEYTAQASIKTAEGQANAKTIIAKADAEVTTVVGNAEAERTKAVGGAEAEVIKQKIDSIGSGNYALIETSKALADSGFKLVPDIVAGGGSSSDASSTGLVNVLIAQLISSRLKGDSPLSSEETAGKK